MDTSRLSDDDADDEVFILSLHDALGVSSHRASRRSTVIENRVVFAFHPMQQCRCIILVEMGWNNRFVCGAQRRDGWIDGCYSRTSTVFVDRQPVVYFTHTTMLHHNCLLLSLDQRDRPGIVPAREAWPPELLVILVRVHFHCFV